MKIAKTDWANDPCPGLIRAIDENQTPLMMCLPSMADGVCYCFGTPFIFHGQEYPV